MRKLTLCAALCLAACGGGNKDNSGRSTTPENAAQQPPSSETQTTSSNYNDNQTPPPSTSTETTMPTESPQTGNTWQQTPGSSATQGTTPSTPPTTGTTTTTGGTMGTTGTGTTSNLSDEQIVAITTAANTGEIQQAQLVKDRTQNAQIRKFAEHMIHDHGQLKADGQKLVTKLKITPQDNQMSLQLTSDSKQLVDTLRGEKGAQFDKDYIDAQVKQHRDLLDALDNKMIPQAQNAEVKAALQSARTKVEAHLKMAEDIQKNLVTKP